jgi:hypothetical protein
MLCAKSWVRAYRGEMAIRSNDLPNGLLNVHVGDRYYVAMTEAEWATLPLYSR